MIRCKRSELSEFIGSAHVLVPLRAKLDSIQLHLASSAQLILQYGVGLEGIDVPTVSS